MEKKCFLLAFIFVFFALILACSALGTPTPQLSDTSGPVQQTQMAINVQQTVLAMEIAQLTQASPSVADAAQPEPGANLPENSPPLGNPPPADLISDTPLFTARENMFCRGGPASGFIDHWMVDQGKSYPVLGKWYNNEWLLVEINDPQTRTHCCWVGGDGDLNVSVQSVPDIDYLPDRMTCQEPDPDVLVWDFNLTDKHFLSCEQITQSTWYFCGGVEDYCTDANYDNVADYQLVLSDVLNNCQGIRFP